MNSVMLMLKKCCAFVFLKQYQILFKEKHQTPALLYIPIYGELNLWSKQNGQFLHRLKLGSVVGEEAICDRLFDGTRQDNCYAEQDSALICIKREEWLELKVEKKADAQLIRDMTHMEDWLRKQYFVKKRWRAGIIVGGAKKTSTLLSGSGIIIAQSNQNYH